MPYLPIIVASVLAFAAGVWSFMNGFLTGLTTDALGGLKQSRDALAAIQSIATTTAIAVGGWWTYRNFIRGREPQPKADLEHKVTHRRFPENKLWLRVELRLTNKGKILLSPGKGETRVYRVLPVSKEFEHKLTSGMSLLADKSTEFAWELLEAPRDTWGQLEIEPGESDGVSYDFLLPDDIKTVLLYSHVEHEPKADGKSFGWSCHTVYDLTCESDLMTDESRKVPADGLRQQFKKALPQSAPASESQDKARQPPAPQPKTEAKE